eukprot:TRINITY_DN840_c0_g4_i3.p1 TRINITY_DN840_c0_g4~~TRINITY_DN840_c0_g4_i3.p1  ORF type:complete len:1453 (-),score=310.19 TRINITY_DN840_c0_g4_i3:95-3829(-)
MEEGSKARTVASTAMNASSSRSHAIFTSIFTQMKKTAGVVAEKVSKIHLVDLAGSERASGTGATGARLKEGANINKSLSTLGKVISALADVSTGKKKKGSQFIPYRDSVLTWLLKESLGGNAKTIMIAAISPADINYSETLSTLRYAERAKRIKNQAVVNEDPTMKLVRDLQEEVKRLKALISSQGISGAVDIVDKLEQNEKLMAEYTKSWDDKQRETEEIRGRSAALLKNVGVAASVDQSVPHFVNLNEDPLMSESLVYYIKDKITKVGSPNDREPPDIMLEGVSINKEHCTIKREGNDVFIVPIGKSVVYVNGTVIQDRTKLNQADRVILGYNHIFRFNSAKQSEDTPQRRTRRLTIKKPKGAASTVDWEFALKELAQAQGISFTIEEEGEEDDEIEAELSAKMKELQDQIEQEKERSTAQKKEFEQKLRLLEEEAAKEQVRAEFAEKEKEQMLRQKMMTEVVQKQKEKLLLQAARRRQEKRNRARLEGDIIRTILLLSEANSIATSLQKSINLQLQLNVLPSYNNSEAPQIKTEVGVDVHDTATGRSTTWSFDEFNKRIITMRELYQIFGERGKLPYLEPKADPFHTTANDELLGVARIYLKSFYYRVSGQDATTPIVDYSSGEKVGTLHFSMASLDSKAAVAEPVKNPKSLKGSQMELVLGLNKVDGLDFQHLRCSYSFWQKEFNEKFDVESIGYNENCEVSFEYKERFSVLATEEFLAYLKTGHVTVEVWATNSGNSSLSGRSNDLLAVPSEEFYEFVCSVELCESEANSEEWETVPIKEEPWNTPSVVFRLKKFRQRRIIISMSECLDPDVYILRCDSIEMRDAGMSDEEAQFDTIPLTVEEVTRTQIIASWNYSVQYASLLNSITPKGMRINATLSMSVQFTKFSKPVTVDKEVCFRIYESNVDFSEGATLERFKGLLAAQQRAEKEKSSGLLFGISLKKERIIDTQAAATAIIEDHQTSISDLERLLEAERYKQEVALQEKLVACGVTTKAMNATSLHVQPEESAKEKEPADDEEEPAPQPRGRRKRHNTLVKVKVVEIRKRQFDKGGYLYKKSVSTKQWKKVWFELRRPYLYYYRSPDEPRERGVLDLTNSIVTIGEELETPSAFAVVSPNKIWILHAENEQDRDEWMFTIDPSLRLAETDNFPFDEAYPAEGTLDHPLVVEGDDFKLSLTPTKPPQDPQLAPPTHIEPFMVEGDDFSLTMGGGSEALTTPLIDTPVISAEDGDANCARRVCRVM